jgi:hypothetical protein
MMGWMAPLRHLSAKLLSDRISSKWEPSMGEITTIGLDLAKHVFQVHGVDAEGATVLRKQLRRAQVWRSSVDCRPVWLAWRRARRRTTGRGNCARLATRCD